MTGPEQMANAARRPPMAIAAIAVASAIASLAAFTALKPDAHAQAGGTPDLSARLANARDGEVITLSPRHYGMVRLRNRSFSPAVTIRAQGATFDGIDLRDVKGVTIIGGTVKGAGGRSRGVNAQSVENIELRDMTVTGAWVGMAMGGSNIRIINNRLTGLISEGIHVPMSRNILIDGNICEKFNPNVTTYDNLGKVITKGDHPDCIQSWSRPKAPPAADITIQNNVMEGRMQGIFFGNHVRNGVNDGGYDRIIIRNNRIKVMYPNAIMLADARNSVVTGNIVETLPGGKSPKPPFRPNKSDIRVSGENNVVCGNRVADFPTNPATRRCK